MRLIDADALKEKLSADTSLHTWTHEYGTAIPIEWIRSCIDNAPTVTGIIDAKDFKKRINNMQYVYIQSCAEDVIDAIDCELTYFKEKMSKDPNSNS